MQKILTGLIVILISSIMFVWPLMHTIGLRYSIAAFLILSVLLWLYLNPVRLSPVRVLLVPTGFLCAITLWFIAQALWIAPESAWVWDELRGQWTKDLVFWFLGLALGLGAVHQQRNGSNQWLIAFLLGLVGLVLINMLLVLGVWISTGQVPRMFDGLTGSRTMTSFITNMLLAFLVGDLLARERARHFLPWARSVTIALIAICVFNTLLSSTRHGWIGLVMITASGVIVHYINGRRQVGKKAVVFLPILFALIVSSAWFSWKTDPRWHTLKETLPIAWDIDANKAWLNPLKYPYPVLPNGQIVNDSNYERPAWIHAGLRMVMDQPLGVGYGRHAFGHELARLYPESEPAEGLHAHSSVIDLTVGGGIPALLLWLGFVVTLAWIGGVGYFKNGLGAGLALLFLTSGFFGRSLFDSIMRDHSMEQFMFMVAFLIPMAGAAVVPAKPDQASEENQSA